MNESDIDPLWVDLTVTNAPAVRDFYEATVGWTSVPVSMGDYDDYAMEFDGHVVAGICHARGVNGGLPPVWLPYFRVVSLKKSLATCRAKGGLQLTKIRKLGDNMRYAVIRDPAGAYAALFEQVKNGLKLS